MQVIQANGLSLILDLLSFIFQFWFIKKETYFDPCKADIDKLEYV
jgi:hypothetical protein